MICIEVVRNDGMLKKESSIKRSDEVFFELWTKELKEELSNFWYEFSK